MSGMVWVRRSFTAMCVFTGFLAAAPVAASTFSIDFSGFAEGTFLDNRVTLAPGLSAIVSSSRNFDGSTGIARVCDTSNGAVCSGNDPDLLSPFTNIDTNGQQDLGNVLIIQNASKSSVDDDGRGGRLTFSDFLYDGEEALILDSLDFVDTIDNPNGGQLFLNGSNANFEDADNMSIFGGGDREFERVSVGLEISSFSVTFGGSGAIDNIELSLAPIPLPMPALMLLAALGATGVAARRRKAAAT